MPTSEPMVLTTDHGTVRTFTLHRPAALNSLTVAMHAQLRDALDRAAADAGVRAIVLTGSGRGFCAGQDLNDPDVVIGEGAASTDLGDVVDRTYRPLALRLQAMPVPVVAAVNGVAAGAGANLALCCDIVVAARSAFFMQAFSKIGLIPDCGGTWLLPRLVGRARAIGLAFTADRLSAEEAVRIGLVWQCVDDAALAGEAAALAARLAAMPLKALAETRRAFDAAGRLELEEALARETVVQRRLGASGDFVEGVTAFRQKRAARFSER